jgi:hypothetical protein
VNIASWDEANGSGGSGEHGEGFQEIPMHLPNTFVEVDIGMPRRKGSQKKKRRKQAMRDGPGFDL